MLIIACGLALVFAQVHAGEEPMVKPRSGLEETLEAQRDSIMALPGVVGTGLSRCDDEPCIMVLADQPSADLERELKRLLGSHRFEIVESGPIRAYPEGR
jgi:hypothetical protein